MRRRADTDKLLIFRMFSSTSVGGVQRIVDGLTDSLRQRGHDVVHLCQGERAGQVRQGHWVLPMTAPRRAREMLQPMTLVKVARSLVSLVRILHRVRPQTVVVFYITFPGLYFLLLRPLFRYRLFLSAGGSDVLQRRGMPDRMAQWFLLRRADGVAAISEPMAQVIRDRQGRSRAGVRTIHNGADLGFWGNGITRRAEDLRAPVVVSVGTLRPVKGHDVLVAAFAQVHAEFPEATLTIVGEGQSRSNLENLAEELGVSDAVKMIGHRSPDEVREVLAQASIFAMPSRSEGFGLALLEGMASGLACIGTRVGGIPDLLDNGVGIMVPPEDPIAMAQALERLLRDPELLSELQVRARRRACDFDWEAMVGKYESFLELNQTAGGNLSGL